MLKYIIHTEELFNVLDVLYKVLSVGVSFYDVNFKELAFFDNRKHKPYCLIQRQDKEFLKGCKLSDYELFDKAKETGEIQLHKCHCGLFDGSVPLYDEGKIFLGIIIFGQVRPKGKQCPTDIDNKLREYYFQLPEMDEDQMINTGKILKFASESIVREKMVGFRRLGWSEKLQRYIEIHLDEPITISRLADLAGKSESFISHHFQKEFGKSPAKYILDKKMEIARTLLLGGDMVGQAADKLGFYDAYHFSKTFKKYYGYSPCELRKDAFL